MSSRCQSAIDLRGPFDAANLGILFGAPSNKSMRMLRENCIDLLRHSQTRRTLKGVLHHLPLKNVKSQSLDRLLKVPEFRVEIEKIRSDEVDSSSSSATKNSIRKIDEPPEKKPKISAAKK